MGSIKGKAANVTRRNNLNWANEKFINWLNSLNIRGNSGQHVTKGCQRRGATAGDNDGRRITRPLDAEEWATQPVTVKVVGAILGGHAGFSRHRRANSVAAIWHIWLLVLWLRLQLRLGERLRLLDERFTPRRRRRTRILFNVGIRKRMRRFKGQWKVCVVIGTGGRDRRRIGVVGGCEIFRSINFTTANGRVGRCCRIEIAAGWIRRCVEGWRRYRILKTVVVQFYVLKVLPRIEIVGIVGSHPSGIAAIKTALRKRLVTTSARFPAADGTGGANAAHTAATLVVVDRIDSAAVAQHGHQDR